MPPDRGAIKKSPYDKRQTVSTSSKKSIKDDGKSLRSKYESSREKELNKTRDSSVSRATKEKSKNEDKNTKLSVQEKLAVLKRETEKTRVASTGKDVMQDRVKSRESHSNSRVIKETGARNTKPTATPNRTPRRTAAAADVGTRRTQLSYHTSRTAEKPKVPAASKEVTKKNTDHLADSKVKKIESIRKPSTKKDVMRAEKLPDKMKHPESKESSRSRSRQAERAEEPKRLSRDRTRTRTLSPREIKVTRSDLLGQQSESLKQEQKELTRSIAAASSVSPEPSTSQGAGDSSEKQETYDGDYDYEDDFEDYESDFEDFTNSDISDEGADVKNDANSGDTDTDSESELVELTPRQQPVVEEEKKLDSGNYDLAERRRKGREIQEIKTALDKENEIVSTQEKTRCHMIEPHVVPVDEGYEEGRSDDHKKFSSAVTHLNFINFANARKRKQEQKATANAKKRGEQLLDMIRLDLMSFNLFELAPIPYEVYMKSYGRSNTLQAHVQTNEDNLSQEIQTDEIHYKNKWTQKPVSFRTKNDRKSDSTDSITIFSQDHLGVGGDSVEDSPESWKERIKINTVRLNQFLSLAGQAVLVLLEEGEMPGANKLNRNLMDIPFSDGYISLGIESVSFLAGRSVTFLRFPHHHSNLLLTVHKSIKLENRPTDDAFLYRSIIAVWSILEPFLPQKLLVAAHEVTACCFDPTTANLVFAGLDDGSVCLWDLREKSYCHQKVETDGNEWVLRSPTYSTAEILKDKGHLGHIVALHPLAGSEVESEISDKIEISPTQVCSLDEGGTLVIWTVIQSYKHSEQFGISHQDLGLAHWGRVRLVCSVACTLTENTFLDQRLRLNLSCFDLQSDSSDHSHLYIGTNTGYVIHSLKNGGKPRPQGYIPNWHGYTSVKCIESCPFGEPYFLVGCGEGTIRLHCQASEKPLATLAGTGDPVGQGPSIAALQWSRSRPFIFFVLDSSSRIHVWDLSKSDIYPVYTVRFGTLTAMQLSPDLGDAKHPPQLALATGPGRVEIHQLRQEYSTQLSDELMKELDKFILYTSIL